MICKLGGVAIFVALTVSGSLPLGKRLNYAFAKTMLTIGLTGFHYRSDIGLGHSYRDGLVPVCSPFMKNWSLCMDGYRLGYKCK